MHYLKPCYVEYQFIYTNGNNWKLLFILVSDYPLFSSYALKLCRGMSLLQLLCTHLKYHLRLIPIHMLTPYTTSQGNISGEISDLAFCVVRNFKKLHFKHPFFR